MRRIECTYCGHVQIRITKALQCEICKDSNLKEQKYDKIDYYEGSPPFEADQEQQEDPFDSYWD